MAQEIYVHIFDAGQYGAKLVCDNPPKVCPGLGGWKTNPDDDLSYITFVKGQMAQKLLNLVNDKGISLVVLTVDDNGKIVDMR